MWLKAANALMDAAYDDQIYVDDGWGQKVMFN